MKLISAFLIAFVLAISFVLVGCGDASTASVAATKQTTIQKAPEQAPVVSIGVRTAVSPDRAVLKEPALSSQGAKGIQPAHTSYDGSISYAIHRPRLDAVPKVPIETAAKRGFIGFAHTRARELV